MGIAQFRKAKAEAHKTRVEADKLEAATGPETESISAVAMKEAVLTMRDIAADANSSRERAEKAEQMMREELQRERAEKADMARRVCALEASQRESERNREVDHRRIERLEGRLTAARDLVEQLVAHIQAHPSTGPVPVIDYTIFDP